MNIFDPGTLRELFLHNSTFFRVGIFLLAFLLTYYLVPKVLWVSWNRRLFKNVNKRSSHYRPTPNFGGIVFFVVFVLLISFLQSIHRLPTGNHLVAAITVLFMVGLKDDLVVSTAKAKFVGELVATILIIFSSEFAITSLHGFMGIYEIPSVVGYLLATFIVVASINAYNLIDGINGLAGVTGIIIALFYGFAFYLANSSFHSLVCLVIAGILLAFLRYNLTNSTKRIFMGDSGSLVIGLLLGAMTLKIFNIGTAIPFVETPYGYGDRVLFVFAVLLILIFDTARVMIIRISNGQSPFEADQNHLHHVFLKRNFSHLQTSLSIGTINIIAVLLYFVLSLFLGTWGILMGLLAYCGVILSLIHFLKKESRSRIVF